MIERLLEGGVRVVAPERAEGGALAGQVVVFTGGLERMSRDEARRLAERHGARTGDAITKATTLVVAGPGAGSKVEKAKKLNIPVIDEAAFFLKIQPSDVAPPPTRAQE